MTFNRNRSGNIVSMVNGEVYRYREDGRLVYAGADTGVYVTVTLTGWYEDVNGKRMYQTTDGGWIDLMDGWESRGLSTAYTATKAQKYVDAVINANKLILQNNLICARFAHHLTAAEQAQLRGLQTRLQARNDSLLNDGLVTYVQTSYPQGYADLSQSLTTFMASPAAASGIGVVITTTALIVVFATVLVSLGTAAYFAYKYMAAEAEQDVKYSKELTRTLMEKLTPEEYEQLKSETAGIVTKAKLRQSLSDFGTVGKVLLVAGAAFGITYLIKKLWN